MRSLGVDSLSGRDKDQITHYLPKEIPAVHVDEDDESSVEESSNSEEEQQQEEEEAPPRPKRGRPKGSGKLQRGRSKSISMSIASPQETKKKRKGKGTDHPPSEFYCLVVECKRYTHGFHKISQLWRHLKNVHTLSGQEMKAALALENAERKEMVGGVHVDGYLRGIKRRPGWRGGDNVTGRKRRSSNFGRRGVSREGKAESSHDEDGDRNIADEHAGGGVEEGRMERESGSEFQGSN